MKFQAIKYTSKGNAFVTFKGKRIHLERFIRTNSPWGQSGDESIIINGKELEVHGWFSDYYCGSYGIHISNCGEAAKVFYKQNF